MGAAGVNDVVRLGTALTLFESNEMKSLRASARSCGVLSADESIFEIMALPTTTPSANSDTSRTFMDYEKVM